MRVVGLLRAPFILACTTSVLHLSNFRCYTTSKDIFKTFSILSKLRTRSSRYCLQVRLAYYLAQHLEHYTADKTCFERILPKLCFSLWNIYAKRQSNSIHGVLVLHTFFSNLASSLGAARVSLLLPCYSRIPIMFHQENDHSTLHTKSLPSQLTKNQIVLKTFTLNLVQTVWHQLFTPSMLYTLYLYNSAYNLDRHR